MSLLYFRDRHQIHFCRSLPLHWPVFRLRPSMDPSWKMDISRQRSRLRLKPSPRTETDFAPKFVAVFRERSTTCERSTRIYDRGLTGHDTRTINTAWLFTRVWRNLVVRPLLVPKNLSLLDFNLGWDRERPIDWYPFWCWRNSEWQK